jgi:2,3-bisphosphoglycerate-dependent phosphoglycerate mutase
MYTLVLVRHGQSLGQVEKGFTGWTDTALTLRGMRQARRCGHVLRTRGFRFDLCYTSMLERAHQTLDLLLEALGQRRPPVVRSWRLNGRHYGDLQGRPRTEMIKLHGRSQVKRWRHEYTLRPPALADDDPRLPSESAIYAEVDPTLLPRSESQADADQRILGYWEHSIEPQVRAGLRVLVVSHNSAIRGLVKSIEGLADAQVADFKVPTAKPLVYSLDAELRPCRRCALETRLPIGLQCFLARDAQPR